MNIAATTTMPTASTNTGNDTMYLAPPRDSATSPGCSAIHAAPHAASAIKPRNKRIRIMRDLLPRFRERSHRIIGELTRGRQCGIARGGLVEPGLRRRAVGRRKLGEIAAGPRGIVGEG